jgi:hypothetical protein
MGFVTCQTEPRRKGLEKKIGGKRRAALQQNEAKCELSSGSVRSGAVKTWTRELGDYGSEHGGQMMR